MIDTRDLSSYYPGYDNYCEPKEIQYEEEVDYYEDYKLEEAKEMERQIINLNDTKMSLEEIFQLENYVWKQDKLIPVELIEGE